MSTKEQLVDEIIKFVVADGDTVTADQRTILERQSILWLENKLRDVQALHEKQCLEAIEKAEQILKSRREAARINAEREANWIEWQVQRGMEIEADRRADQARKGPKARKVFEVVCRKHNLSLAEANFRILFDGDFLDSEYTADQAISSNAVSLAPANQEEAEKFYQERIDEYNQTLLNASPESLRQKVRLETEQKRIREQQQQANEHFETIKQQDAVMGYPPLPAEITKEQIRAAATDRLKVLIKRYGNANITARLQGRG